MELIIHVVVLATAVVGLATAMVKAMSIARGERPETKRDRRR